MKPAAQDAIAAREGDVEAARAHVAEMEQRRDAQQRDLRDLQGDIDAAQQLSSHETERLHRQELALGRIRADLSQLSDRLWNTYELSYAGAEEALREYDARKQGKAPRTANPYPRPLTKTPPTRRRAASATACARWARSTWALSRNTRRCTSASPI